MRRHILQKINLDQFMKEANLTQSTKEAMQAINGGCKYGIGFKCGEYILAHTISTCKYNVIHKTAILAAAKVKGLGTYEAEEIVVGSGTTTVVTKLN